MSAPLRLDGGVDRRRKIRTHEPLKGAARDAFILSARSYIRWRANGNEDRAQDMYLATCQAADTFDPTQGVAPLTWIKWWIRSSVSHSVRSARSSKRKAERIYYLDECNGARNGPDGNAEVTHETLPAPEPTVTVDDRIALQQATRALFEAYGGDLVKTARSIDAIAGIDVAARESISRSTVHTRRRAALRVLGVSQIGSSADPC